MRFRFLIFGLLAIGCNRTRAPATMGGSTSTPEVRVWGELKKVMHEGKTGPQVSLAEAVHDGPVIAVGALSGLRGEVTILGDRALLTFGGADGSTRTATEL